MAGCARANRDIQMYIAITIFLFAAVVLAYGNMPAQEVKRFGSSRIFRGIRDMKDLLIASLTDAGLPLELFACQDGGEVLVLPHGGRILGLFTAESSQNFLWTHPHSTRSRRPGPFSAPSSGTIPVGIAPGWLPKSISSFPTIRI